MEQTKNKKLGIALSGGGFRASLFHIGVLASLAENDILKDLQVISCVSGGSIIGAYYYLHLKKLLESKEDTKITKTDYINIIKEIETDFLENVQKNLRVKILSSLKSNFKMVFWGDEYSRSDRIANLYDWHFYNKFCDDFDSNNDGKISMNELIIHPYGVIEPEKIRDLNESRINKIPMLIINSTTLNTGRNWQFTAVDMGEREELIEENKEYNKNSLFKSFKYKSASVKSLEKLFGKEVYEKYLYVPLRIAVASSASVPGVFTPMALTKLYIDIVPLLVDGGVYDNQGISSILYENCDEIIISDASGQMDFEKKTNNDSFGVLRRANSIMMNRIRNLEFEFLSKYGDTKHFMILHLREDLDTKIILPSQKKDKNEIERTRNTYYGINKYVQFLLSKLRTDLDSFTDVEAYSLMYSGYCMSNFNLKRFRNIEFKNNLSNVWNFLNIKEYCESINNEKFIDQLKNGKKTLIKTRRISILLFLLQLLIFIFTAFVTLLPIIIVYIFFDKIKIFGISLLCIMLYAYFIASLVFLISLLSRFISTIQKHFVYVITTGIISFFIALSGSIMSKLYLLLINNRVNEMGKISRLKINVSIKF